MKNALKWLSSSFKKDQSKEIAFSYQSIFNHTSQGVQILKDLSLYCNFYNSSFSGEDYIQMAFNEGARDVLLHILEMSKLSEKDILELNNIYQADK